MKQLNVTFEDEEYILLSSSKERSRLGWREFLLSLVKPEEEKPNEDN